MKKLLLIAAISLLAACAPGKKGADLKYAGLNEEQREEAVASYVARAMAMSVEDGQAMMMSLFDEIVAEQRADSSSHVYLLMTEMVSKYLYDPNSPLRDEDLYLPFVTAMSESEFTAENMRPAYRYEARVCSMNRRGRQVHDFTYRDAAGRDHRLFGIEADYTLLFFSNPGCQACRGIIEDIVSVPGISDRIASGRLAVISLYIDSDIDLWRQHTGDYPSDWIVGYDPAFTIRENIDYNVRAIPSVYVLDQYKRVVLKDAPDWRFLGFLQQL